MTRSEGGAIGQQFKDEESISYMTFHNSALRLVEEEVRQMNVSLSSYEKSDTFFLPTQPALDCKMILKFLKTLNFGLFVKVLEPTNGIWRVGII